MKPIPSSLPDTPPVLAFGAHPGDIRFGCGGVIARPGAMIEYATTLFPADPPLFASLSGLGRGARGF